MSPTPLISVALAILYQQGRFLLQLRDDIPTIIYPGQWGLFGGHLEGEETPTDGIQRELLEEIGHIPPQLDLWGCDRDERVMRYLFHGPLGLPVDSLVLGEGQDLALATLEDIVEGHCYSPRLGQERVLAALHRRLLLAFWQTSPKIQSQTI
ncbi:MAG: NUDIX domain-containing protein [Chloroflexaceae bacterium]|nr:NUDIX domain-containing protein [Chloroflexaceae bacterium]